MIEPKGNSVDVLGIKSGATKAMALKQGAMGQKQSHVYGGAQDDKAFPDSKEGPTSAPRTRMDAGRKSVAGQDAGSIQAAFVGTSLGRLNKGAPETTGKTPAGDVNATRKTKQTNPDPDPGTVVPPIFGKPDSVLLEGHGPAIAS